MREIKFRVWNDYRKEYETLQHVANRGAVMPRDNELKITINYTIILEQFTGLVDKNGVEIYEGDIVQIRGGEYYQGIYEFDEKVTVEDIMYCLQYFNGINSMDEVEVIGNIHNDK